MAGAADLSQTIEFGRFTVISHRRELLADGRPIELGGRAFDTLMVLIDARGTVLGKDELMNRVWPDRVVEENNLQAQISALRKVFGADRDLIRTVAGRGYQFTGEIRKGVTSGAAVPARLTNLPTPQSELIGREAPLRDVTNLVVAHRLVTLTGAGGVGKTRLALEATRQLLPRFLDGAWLAELGSLADADLVPVAVAAALGLSFGAGPVTTDRVAVALRAKHLLLVIDNCEHVIEVAAAMAEAVLRASPLTRVLATSRESLRATEEYVYRVPSLDVPVDDNVDVEDVSRHGAVRLFNVRAHAAEPGYDAHPRHAVVAARICRRLDGIPLAIELAAARVPAFGVDGIASRLGDRFHLLTEGSRTGLTRHQTLRATLDWSYELLSDVERIVLRRLGKFAGAFRLESAQAVAAGSEVAVPAIPEIVANLVAKSLVAADLGEAVVHYRLLETTRVYAREALLESGEHNEVARRHGEHHRDLLDRAATDSETLPPDAWPSAYGRALDDVRAALDWAFSPEGDLALGIALTVAAVPLWGRFSLLEEWRERVERALARLANSADRDPAGEMQLSAALAQALLLTKGPVPEAHAAWSTAFDIAETLRDTDYQLRSLWGLFVYRFTIGESRAAQATAEQFRRLAEDARDPVYKRVGDRIMGNILHILGEQTRARRHHERLSDRYVTRSHRSHSVRFIWDERVLAQAFYARILCLQGLPDRALEIVEQCVTDAQAADHPTSLFYALIEAACPVALLAGNLPAADRFLGLLGDLARTHAQDLWHAWHRCFTGALFLERGEVVTASRTLRGVLDAVPEIVFHFHRTVFLGDLGEALGRSGEVAEGLALIDQALERARRREEWWYVPELLRKRGEVSLLADAAVSATAEEHFREALAMARGQGALAWELRIATSLAGLWHRQRRSREARSLLAPVYRRFTEGFGTADLTTARALLHTLRSSRLMSSPRTDSS